MLRKQGEGVAQAFHDLVLGYVAGESQVGALKSRATEARYWRSPSTARLSKQQIEQDIVRKARHILKRPAAST